MYKLYLLLFLCITRFLFCVDVILLFGPPGSGKGTFSQFAKEKGYGHISAGDLIRHEISCQSEVSALLEETLKRGDFIDSSLMFQLLKKRSLEFVKKDIPFIIDGYGRTAHDMVKLQDFLKEIQANAKVLFLDASDANCKKRIATRLICPSCDYIYNQKMGHHNGDLCSHCHNSFLQVRINDLPEITNKRLNYYRQNTAKQCSQFQNHLPSISYNTDCDLETCLTYYDSLLKDVH